MAETVDEAIAKIPDGWWLTLDRYIITSEPHESEYMWRAWLRRLAGDVEGDDGPCYLLKAFGRGRTPAEAIIAARIDTHRFSVTS
jgi:hypothetical protein